LVVCIGWFLDCGQNNLVGRGINSAEPRANQGWCLG
jgi:hypothetical protein